jgi:hypothetical protein
MSLQRGVRGILKKIAHDEGTSVSLICEDFLKKGIENYVEKMKGKNRVLEWHERLIKGDDSPPLEGFQEYVTARHLIIPLCDMHLTDENISYVLQGAFNLSPIEADTLIKIFHDEHHEPPKIADRRRTAHQTD